MSGRAGGPADQDAHEGQGLLSRIDGAPKAKLSSEDVPTHDEVQAASRNHVSILVIGVLLLVGVSVIWTAASVLVQYIFETLKFPNPFFLTYVCNSEFALLLPMEMIRHKWLARERRAGRDKCCGCCSTADEHVSWRDAAKAALGLSFVWFTAQGSYNASLGGTTVSVSTVLSACSCIFTMILSSIYLPETFSWITLVGVLLT
jgi:solute carrier family 35, member F5